MNPAQSAPAATRFLERALLFTFLTHGLAMMGMVLLLSGMPGGGAADASARIAYIAAHPWLWRLGWLPWQITAMSDLLLAIALLRAPWIPRLPAYLTLLLTCAALVPDQGGQALWATQGVQLAADAVRTHDVAAYLHFEAATYRTIAAWAATLYTLGALGWTWCFAGAGTWSRRLTWLSVATWSVFLGASVGPLLPVGLRPPPAAIAAGNALGFVLLEAWFLMVLEQVLRRSRPDALDGRFTHWKSPRSNAVGRICDMVANSRAAHMICEFLPCLAFDSDVADVVYVSYLVAAERLEPLVPTGLQLQTLGPHGEFALFTFLTYRHGHFGPRILHGLRRLLPSPVQTNWRIYVVDPRTRCEGVCFLINAISNPLYALGARLMLEALPIHALAGAELDRGVDGCFSLRLDPGAGSGPDVEATLYPTENRALPAPWSACFGDYEAMLAYCVPQNRALASQPWYGRISRQEIRLDIPLICSAPLAGEVRSRKAQEVAGAALPLCFHVPKVAFHFDRQEFDPLPAGTEARDNDPS